MKILFKKKVRSQTEYTDAQIRVTKIEQALKEKIEEVENLKKAARLYNQDIKELEKYGEDLREHYEKSKVIHKKTEQELNELKSTHSKMLSEYEEIQKQCSLLKTRCHQLESERLPLIAQLEFADRNLRQVKKQQQQTAMTTSTTVHHQPSNPVLQSIENNNNKSISRLIRSPSLDMRVMRRTNDKMDDTRSLDHDDLALLIHKNQSFNNFPISGRSTDHIAKYEIENEEEPIHLDLGSVDYNRRMTELQRRNLSQPKHLRTAYALETMDQDPDDFSASFIRKGGAINDEHSTRQRIANENQKGSETPKASRFKNLFHRK